MCISIRNNFYLHCHQKIKLTVNETEIYTFEWKMFFLLPSVLNQLQYKSQANTQKRYKKKMKIELLKSLFDF